MRLRYGWVVSLSLGLLAAGELTWKDKPVAEWSEVDAKQVLTDSPWAKSVAPNSEKQQSMGRPSHRRMGGLGGIEIGGIGIGTGNPRRGGGSESRQPRTPPKLLVRWESALPVQEAELKARNANAPSVDEGHYAVVVLGLPTRMADALLRNSGHTDAKAELKRDGKKAIKASDVKMLSREDGPMVVFLFPRSKEIVARDKQVKFEARIGSLALEQTFELQEMTYAGKLEL